MRHAGRHFQILGFCCGKQLLPLYSRIIFSNDDSYLIATLSTMKEKMEWKKLSKFNPPRICEWWLASRYYSRKLPWHCLLFHLERFLLQLHFIDGASRVRGGIMRDEKQAHVTTSRKRFTCTKQSVSKTESRASLTNRYVSTVVLKAELPQTNRHPPNQNRGFCTAKRQNLGWHGHWWRGQHGTLTFRLGSHPVTNFGQSPCREELIAVECFGLKSQWCI